jgi:hypothetical protein
LNWVVTAGNTPRQPIRPFTAFADLIAFIARLPSKVSPN